ncbi:hypothetical protein [Janthinobacterium sp. RB2R34]|uniref:hypothetical protein n=1 Tax=Janthinobacterium sp. RB2R34 TaxID=3424193 RepID=UPI003F22DB10
MNRTLKVCLSCPCLVIKVQDLAPTPGRPGRPTLRAHHIATDVAHDSDQDAVHDFVTQEELLKDADIDLIGDLGNSQDDAASSDDAGIGRAGFRARKEMIYERQEGKGKATATGKGEGEGKDAAVLSLMFSLSVELRFGARHSLKEHRCEEEPSLSLELAAVIRKMLTNQEHMDRVHQRICGSKMLPRARIHDRDALPQGRRARILGQEASIQVQKASIQDQEITPRGIECS